MQITISVSHTFEDAERFAEFAPELKAFLDRFFSGAPSPQALPEPRSMMPRERVATAPMIGDAALPAVSSLPAQPAPILGAAGEAFRGGGGRGGAPTTLEFNGTVADATASACVTEEAPAVSPSLSQPGPTSSEEPAPTKRKRRTKAEMAAARASGAVAPLPNAGSFGGPATTSAPPAPAAEPDPFDPFNPASQPAKPAASVASASGLTYADVKAAFAPLLMHEDSEPHVLEVIGRFGLTKLNECMNKPELWAPVRGELLKLQKTLGVAA
jgi:hypothetical protein